jgi:nitrate/TMAO reductase-like tetraheme cytochrome c subunit
VQLWSENCSRCHNMRQSDEFSDAQWAAIVHHMRLRANLTGDDARKITTFLQASN